MAVPRCSPKSFPHNTDALIDDLRPFSLTQASVLVSGPPPSGLSHCLFPGDRDGAGSRTDIGILSWPGPGLSRQEYFSGILGSGDLAWFAGRIGCILPGR